MAVYFVPAVIPVAYPALYELCGGRLPPTFWEWRMMEDARRRELVAEGHHVVGVAVAPRDVGDYCRTMNCAADGAALGALATQLGNERFVAYENTVAMRNGEIIGEDPVTGWLAAPAGGLAPARYGNPTAYSGVVPVRRRWWQFWRPRTASVAVAAGAAAIAARAYVRGTAPQRHWWQFWRPRTGSVAVPVSTVETAAPGYPAYVGDVAPRRPWWQFWRPASVPVAVPAAPVDTGTRAYPAYLDEVAPRRPWWQFWRPQMTSVPAQAASVGATGPAYVERVEPRRHWWEFWRPRVVRTTVPTRPFGPRTA